MPTPELPSPLAVEEIFRAAAALPTADRAAYLEAACQGQPAVRARLERMLALGGIAALLQKDGDETVPLEIEAERARLKPEGGGERIGNYKLLQQIGQGGFGIVWMAEQLEPVRRRVALKIIKLGMDTKEVIARFEQERQALAMMDHPNIAKVFDAGMTPTGRPFFVMELVRGVKITAYCDQANLSTAERLALFIAVCHAVQHAHQKGIIHRDLKPSNILVTLHDGVPVPKVIDFGVAKATQAQRLTDLTFFTQFEQMIGTPLYMSPEQAEMSGLDIDTRSDIYSLGVLLYELLTGRTPFDPQELMRKGIDEMRRAIREQEPQKPSTALHTMAAEARTTIAQHRQSDGAKLIGLIAGDLDWIVMKALEKDRTRRYDTANGLAADIKRHLSDEPVLASPPTASYRLQKFVRKHRVTVAVAAGFVLVLTATTVVSLVLALWANRERTHAESAGNQARRSERLAQKSAEEGRAVLTFFQDKVLAAARPKGQDGGLGRSATIQAAVDAAEPEIARAFTNRPFVEASIRETLAATYVHLGRYPQAIEQGERAWALRKSALTIGSSESGGDNLGLAYLNAGRLDHAVPLLEENLMLRKATLGSNDFHTLRMTYHLAQAYIGSKRMVEAEGLLREVVERMRENQGGDKLMRLAHFLNELGECLLQQDKYTEAERFLRESVSLYRQLPVNPSYGGCQQAQGLLGWALLGQKKFTEAEALLVEAYEGLTRREANRPSSSRAGPLRAAGERILQLYEAWGKPGEAAKWKKKLAEVNDSVAEKKASDPAQR